MNKEEQAENRERILHDIWTVMMIYQESHYGIPPTMRYIMEKVGVSSLSVMSSYFKKLIKRGWVKSISRNGSSGEKKDTIWIALKAKGEKS